MSSGTATGYGALYKNWDANVSSVCACDPGQECWPIGGDGLLDLSWPANLMLERKPVGIDLIFYGVGRV